VKLTRNSHYKSLLTHWPRIASCHATVWRRKYYCSIVSVKSRDSSVGIALGYGLDDRGFRVRFPTGAGNFSLHHRVQNSSKAHLVFYPTGTKGSFPGVKRPGREADNSPPSSAEFKEWVELYLHSPNKPSGRGAQLKHRDNFTYYLLPLTIVSVREAWKSRIVTYFVKLYIHTYIHKHTHTHIYIYITWLDVDGLSYGTYLGSIPGKGRGFPLCQHVQAVTLPIGNVKFGLTL
jgi:hypothetical protein